MDRIIAANTVAVGSGDTAPLTGTPGQATDGNPGSGIPATIWASYQYNAIQEELVAAIQDAGITLDKTNNTLLRQAIRRLAGRNVTSLSASGTLTLDQQGLVLVSAASGNVTLTLPAANASGRPIRYDIVRTDSSANSVTVQRAGSDLIGGATTLALLPGERVGITADASANWRVTADGRYFSSISATTAVQKIPNGTNTPLIMQSGKVAFGDLGGTATIAVTFPLTFPNNCINVFPQAALTGGFNVSTMTSDGTISTTGFTAIVAEAAAVVQSGGQLRWFAIGN